MEYNELYDKIQDVTNDVVVYCGLQQMTTNPNQNKYKHGLLEKMSSLASKLSDVAHELNEHLAWDLISKDGERITIGAKVRWYNPEVECRDLEKTYTVDKLCGEMVSISNEFSKAEVSPSELEIVKTENKQKVIDKCPYCGSENFEFMGDNDYWNGKPFHCHECDNWFSEEDNEREDTRHKISALLEGTSEENPKKISFIIPSAEEDAVGLSTLEMPTVESIFELEGDGTIWFHICGENANGEPVWHDIDDLSITDMKGLLSCLLEQ